METKHTPGPWTVTADGAGWYIECAPERGHSVAYIMAEIGEEDPDTSDDEKEANARLIAAAPDLLEALQWLVDILPDPDLDNDELQRTWTRRARAAIAKATGGAARATEGGV